jgi:hypothetical protein
MLGRVRHFLCCAPSSTEGISATKPQSNQLIQLRHFTRTQDRTLSAKDKEDYAAMANLALDFMKSPNAGQEYSRTKLRWKIKPEIKEDAGCFGTPKNVVLEYNHQTYALNSRYTVATLDSESYLEFEIIEDDLILEQKATTIYKKTFPQLFITIIHDDIPTVKEVYTSPSLEEARLSYSQNKVATRAPSLMLQGNIGANEVILPLSPSAHPNDADDSSE